MVRRDPRCRPGSRVRHPGCRGGTRAADARYPGCRSPAPGAGSPGCRARHPGVPRPAAGFSPPRKFGRPWGAAARHPGCRAWLPGRHPGCRGGTRGAAARVPRRGEMRWRFTSRAYLERISVAISSSVAQVWGAAAAPGVPRRGTRGGGRAPERPPARTRAAAPRHPRCRLTRVAYNCTSAAAPEAGTRAARPAPEAGTRGAGVAPGAGTRGAGAAPEVPAPY